MSDINKAVLKVAQSNPVFAKALQAELSKTASKAEVYIDPDYRTVRVASFIKDWGSQSDMIRVFGEVDRLTKAVYETLKRQHVGIDLLSTLAHGRAKGIWVMSGIMLKNASKEDFFQVLTDSRLRTKPWKE